MSEGDDPRDGDDETRDGSAADVPDEPESPDSGETNDGLSGDGGGGDGDGSDEKSDDGPGFRADAATQDDIDELRREIDELEEHVNDRTVHRENIESELKRYIRWRMRRGHATGWGPYLVLLYGTIMTLGAFFYLKGVWAILAMLVLWLSTLGLYTLMVIVGISITVLRVPRGLVSKLREFR